MHRTFILQKRLSEMNIDVEILEELAFVGRFGNTVLY